MKPVMKKYETFNTPMKPLTAATILFASYSYFCKEENFYLNKFQNTPSGIRKNISQAISPRIAFMKPGQICRARDSKELRNALIMESKIAEDHWEEMIKKIRKKKEQ